MKVACNHCGYTFGKDERATCGLCHNCVEETSEEHLHMKEKDGNDMTIGETIKKERKKKNLGQEELARLAEIAVKTLYKIECGETKSPEAITIAKIAAVLGISQDSIMKSKRKE